MNSSRFAVVKLILYCPMEYFYTKKNEFSKFTNVIGAYFIQEVLN